MASDYAWVFWCPESVFAPAALNDQQKIRSVNHALTPLARARAVALMMAPAAGAR